MACSTVSIASDYTRSALLPPVAMDILALATAAHVCVRTACVWLLAVAVVQRGCRELSGEFTPPLPRRRPKPSRAGAATGQCQLPSPR